MPIRLLAVACLACGQAPMFGFAYNPFFQAQLSITPSVATYEKSYRNNLILYCLFLKIF